MSKIYSNYAIKQTTQEKKKKRENNEVSYLSLMIIAALSHEGFCKTKSVFQIRSMGR